MTYEQRSRGRKQGGLCNARRRRRREMVEEQGRWQKAGRMGMMAGGSGDSGATTVYTNRCSPTPRNAPATHPGEIPIPSSGRPPGREDEKGKGEKGEMEFLRGRRRPEVAVGRIQGSSLECTEKKQRGGCTRETKKAGGRQMRVAGRRMRRHGRGNAGEKTRKAATPARGAPKDTRPSNTPGSPSEKTGKQNAKAEEEDEGVGGT